MMKNPPNKNNHDTTKMDMDTNTGKRKGDTPSKTTQEKKPFMGHGCRRTKKQLRIDFATATTHQQAQSLWYEVMTILRNTDQLMLIHNPAKYDQNISSKDPLPEKTDLHQYTCIVETGQNKQNQKNSQASRESQQADPYMSSSA